MAHMSIADKNHTDCAKIRSMSRQRKRQIHLMRQGFIYSHAGDGHSGAGWVGFWWLDPKVLTLSDGLWLSFTTAATVGYGDLVPSTHASRAFSVVVVLLAWRCCRW